MTNFPQCCQTRSNVCGNPNATTRSGSGQVSVFGAAVRLRSFSFQILGQSVRLFTLASAGQSDRASVGAADQRRVLSSPYPCAAVITTMFMKLSLGDVSLSRVIGRPGDGYFCVHSPCKVAHPMHFHTPSVIIVSPLGCAHHIRNALLSGGATTHVFNTYAGALTLLRRKKIDTVVLEFARDQATADFCEAVRSLNIPLVYASPPGSLRLYG